MSVATRTPVPTRTRRMSALAAALAVLLAAVLVQLAPIQRAEAATGFTVQNGRIVDATGADFVVRGINHPHAWYATQTSSFANIKAAGANSVRVVLSGGRYTYNTAADVSNVISLCKANQLICILENHDTTGYGEQAGAYTLDQAADYWLAIKSALIGQEAYTMINIGNEPIGNLNYSTWASQTSSAIQKLRAGGLSHTLVVDAPNWGQDWSFTMRDSAPSVFASDPQLNTVFDIHMYGVFDTAAEVTAYLDSFTSRGLPIMVGEFGDLHSDGNPDEATIMSYTTAKGLGYAGWSWSGNGGGVEYLDMVSGFNPAQRTSWGTRFIDGANGLKATSVQAKVYG